MAENHDEIDELLAGYVLRSLSGEDADATDRLLSEHVPACPMCRETLAGFQAVAGELALASAPVAPPDLLLPGIRRALVEEPSPARRRPLVLFAAAASIVAVLGMAGLSVSLGVRTSHMRQQNSLLREALGAASRPDASQVSLAANPQSQTPLTEITAPGLERIYLMGHDIPMPAPGHVYRVWFGKGGQYTSVGEFLPDPDFTVLRLLVDPTRYDEILITEEPRGPAPAVPSGAVRWSATL